MINHLIKTAASIEVVSGEGNIGTAEPFTGVKSLAAIRRRLNKEKVDTRWAFVRIKTPENTTWRFDGADYLERV